MAQKACETHVFGGKQQHSSSRGWPGKHVKRVCFGRCCCRRRSRRCCRMAQKARETRVFGGKQQHSSSRGWPGKHVKHMCFAASSSTAAAEGGRGSTKHRKHVKHMSFGRCRCGPANDDAEGSKNNVKTLMVKGSPEHPGDQKARKTRVFWQVPQPPAERGCRRPQRTRKTRVFGGFSGP